jgi:uncharacterized zinc-type alcohol dehydrogenase-like protein
LCPQATFTIVGHKGAFASRVRAHWGWAVPLPEKINVAEAGPLLCGGMTVFNPLGMHAKPTSPVGIIGIGGLGHMAVKFAAAYGCEVTALTSSESKLDEARMFGANRVVSNRNSDVIESLSPKVRPSMVKDIADAVMYLTDAATVTGHILRIDCGAQFAG